MLLPQNVPECVEVVEVVDGRGASTLQRKVKSSRVVEIDVAVR
jgi:hypothetical protein